MISTTSVDETRFFFLWRVLFRFNDLGKTTTFSELQGLWYSELVSWKGNLATNASRYDQERRTCFDPTLLTLKRELQA